MLYASQGFRPLLIVRCLQKALAIRNHIQSNYLLMSPITDYSSIDFIIFPRWAVINPTSMIFKTFIVYRNSLGHHIYISAALASC